MRFWVGADIGGTFTDLFSLNLDTGECFSRKLLTDHKDPTQSVVRGLADQIEAGQLPAADVGRVLHATTLVTNTLLQRRGARTALLVTEGFRDAVEIGTEHRFDLYDLNIEKPAPLVPRRFRRPVRERILADGSVDTPLDADQARQEIERLISEGVQSIAVCLHHAYRNPAHERALGQLIEGLAPQIPVSLSSRIAPEIREYERASTAVINAYVAPQVLPYLRSLADGLARLGVPGQLLIMQSNGGTATAETSGQFPVRLLESGPAAGAIGAAYIARQLDRRRVLSFDMGGTTAKAYIVDDGEPLLARKLEVAHVYRFKRGSGLPVQIPAIDTIEIGAGGGSIAQVDRLGLLKVGPQSAESDPGPACYGLGGTLPTVTDADLVLGYIGAGSFLGGTMKLDEPAARQAIERHVAGPLGLSLEEAAWGIHQVVNENMAQAARMHLLEHGRTPGDYVMVAFGGAGPTHGYGVARALGMREIVVPRQAGVGSAYGLLCAPVAFEEARSYPVPLDEVDWPAMDKMLEEMLGECRRSVEWAGVPAAEIVETRMLDLRYRGQGHEVRISLDGLSWPAPHRDDVLLRFREAYRQLNAFEGPSAPVDAITWRVTARGAVPRLPGLRDGAGADASATGEGMTRPVYFQEAGGFTETSVLPFARLSPGSELQGPAIVELGDANITVGPSATLCAREDGLVILYLDKD